MKESQESTYPNLATLKVVYNGIARRVKIPYDMKWHAFEEKVCSLFNITPPLITNYKDDMGVSVIVDNEDDFYFFLDEEFTGLLYVMNNETAGDGLAWTVVRNEVENNGETNASIGRGQSAIPSSAITSSPATSMSRMPLSNTTVEYFGDAISTLTNENEPLISTDGNNAENFMPNNQELSLLEKENTDENNSNELQGDIDASNLLTIEDAPIYATFQNDEETSLLENEKNNNEQEDDKPLESEKPLFNHELPIETNSINCALPEAPLHYDEQNITLEVTKEKPSTEESKTEIEETILYEAVFPDESNISSDKSNYEDELILDQSNKSEQDTQIRDISKEDGAVSLEAELQEQDSTKENSEDQRSNVKSPNLEVNLEDKVTVEECKDTESIYSSERASQAPLQEATTSNIDPLSSKIQTLRNLCHTFNDTLRVCPSSLLIVELFSEQIFNGVPINLELFEQSLNRISDVNKHREHYPTAEESASEVIRNVKNLIIQLGSSMSEFVEKDLIPFINSNLESHKWTSASTKDEAKQKECQSETLNNNGELHDIDEPSTSNSKNEEGYNCPNAPYEFYNPFEKFFHFGIPTPFLRAKHFSRFNRFNHHGDFTSKRCGRKRGHCNHFHNNEYVNNETRDTDINNTNEQINEHNLNKENIPKVPEDQPNTSDRNEPDMTKINQNFEIKLEEAFDEFHKQNENEPQISTSSENASNSNDSSQRLNNIEDHAPTDSLYNHLYPMKELFKIPLGLMSYNQDNSHSNQGYNNSDETSSVSKGGNTVWINDPNLPGSFLRPPTPPRPINHPQPPMCFLKSPAVPVSMDIHSQHNYQSMNNTFNESSNSVANPFSDEFAIKPECLDKPVEYINQEENRSQYNPILSSPPSPEVEVKFEDPASIINPADVELLAGLGTLREMGFPNDVKNLEILQECNLDVTSAIERLINEN